MIFSYTSNPTGLSNNLNNLNFQQPPLFPAVPVALKETIYLKGSASRCQTISGRVDQEES